MASPGRLCRNLLSYGNSKPCLKLDGVDNRRTLSIRLRLSVSNCWFLLRPSSVVWVHLRKFLFLVARCKSCAEWVSK